MSYLEKYLKYKAKYLSLSNQQDGGYKKKQNKNISHNHEINVSDPWFNKIKTGKKTVEGRLNKGVFKEIKPNDIIKVKNDKNYFYIKVIKTTKYETFSDMIINKGLENVLPDIKTLDDGVAVYRQFYSEDKENEFKVLAITVKVIS
jgi:ASC-1-like (ASCH) protein